MRPSAEARFGIASLLALQLLTSAAGVVLLGRMSPAVERILEENVVSTEAVEAMLGTLAADGPREDFDRALQRAQGNITEPDEVELLDAIAAGREAASGASAATRIEVVQKLRDLGEVNRTSMREADERAQALGLAGAWAMALLGFAGFVMSLVVFRRVESRLLQPIVEIDAVLDAVRSGDELRRCTWHLLSPQGSRLAANLNWLLDRRLPVHDSAPEDASARACLLLALDAYEDVAVLAGDGDGRVVAVNQAAASGSLLWGEAARRIAAGHDPDGWSTTRGPSGVWLARGPLPGGGGTVGGSGP